MTAEEIVRAEIAAWGSNNVDEVMSQRRDHWIVNGKQMSWPVMGAYEVRDEKITAWREYFYPPKES